MRAILYCMQNIEHTHESPKLAVSRKSAVEMLDISTWSLDKLIKEGQLNPSSDSLLRGAF